jgi:hypothetical protein
MTAITRIDLRLVTGNRSNAGTDDNVYLGICGREFYVDSSSNDFEQGSDRIYTFGVGSNVTHAEENDPRTPFALQTENLGRFPVYIRHEPVALGENSWNVERVTVTVNPGTAQVQFDALAGANNLWLGVFSGRYCYLA